LLARLEGEVERCSVRLKRVLAREGVKFFDRYVNLVEASAKELGYSHMRMYSGPGHDAQFLSYIMPAAMVFVPSNGGHAQCEREYTHIDRCAKGADVLLNTILKMDVR
ncbi:MAG: M20/M25/M40 family metallo-hydrolase, partial [Christensenellaceae bacterium]